MRLARSPLFRVLTLAVSSVGASVLVASPALADFNWDSQRSRNGNANAQGFYNVLLDPSLRDQSRSSNNYNTDQVDGVPTRRYADYFYSGATAYWSNINVPALAAGQYFAIESRAGYYGSQEFKVDFYPANSPDGTSPVYTSYTKRMRWNTWEYYGNNVYSNAGWQGAAWNYQPYLDLTSVPTGNYDIKVTANNNDGGHFAGLGVWSPQYTAPSAGRSLRIEAENYSWSNGPKYVVTDGSTTFSGTGYLNQPLNSDGGNGYVRDWIDYEIFNPKPGRKYTLTMATRSGNTDPAVYELQSLFYWGDIVNFGTPLVQLTTQGTGGWEGTSFVRTTSATFELPTGTTQMPLVRLTKIGGGGQHIDYLEITAAPSEWKDVTGTWADTNNWTDDVPDLAGTRASFPQTSEPRSVSLSSDRVVGGVSITSSQPYTFGGSGKLILNGETGTATLSASGSSHTIGNAVVLQSSTAISVSAGTVLSVKSLTSSSAGNAVSLSGGGTLKLAGAEGNGSVYVGALPTVSADGSLLDLVKGAAVFQSGSESDVRQLVIRWLGGQGGLGSSMAGGGLTLAVLPNDEGLVDSGVANGIPYYDTFAGVTGLTAANVLVRLTYAGDVNLDGKVDGADVKAALERITLGRAGWAGGDFDYANGADATDFALLVANLNRTPLALPSGEPALATGAVPEPGMLALPALAMLGVARRRRA